MIMIHYTHMCVTYTYVHDNDQITISLDGMIYIIQIAG